MLGLGARQKKSAGLGLAAFYRQSLDGDIRRLVNSHGADAVREATKRITRKKPGRKQEIDLPLLRDWFEQDAIDWLEGRDPAAIRSNYAMAKYVAQLSPEHHQTAVHRRVLRKLAKRRERIILIRAMEIAEESRPFLDYLRTLEGIAANDPKWSEYAITQADILRGKLERYKDRYGQIDPNLTIPAIEDALKVKELGLADLGIAALLENYKG